MPGEWKISGVRMPGGAPPIGLTGTPSRPAWADAPPGTGVVLHVGCGTRPVHETFGGPEWREVRLDIDPNVAPDVVASIVDMSPVPDASVDAVWSSHNLEHVYAYEVPIVLGEFFRVLRPGGTALMTMPDLQSVAALIAKGDLEDVAYEAPAGPITPLDIVYGYGRSIAEGNEFMAHRTGYTAKTLEAKLVAAGFADVRVMQRPEQFDLWGRGTRPV